MANNEQIFIFFTGSVLVLLLLPTHHSAQYLTIQVTRISPETPFLASLPKFKLSSTSIHSNPLLSSM